MIKRISLIIFLLVILSTISFSCFSEKIYVGQVFGVEGKGWNGVSFSVVYCGMISDNIFSLAVKASAFGKENYFYPLSTQTIQFYGSVLKIIKVTSEYLIIEKG